MSTHLIFEGSSSTNGFGDELHHGGFAGRIDSHLREHYEHLIDTDTWTRADGWSYVTNHAQCNQLLPEWVGSMPGHMSQNLRRSRFKEQTGRLGIFVLEGHPLYLQRRYDQTHSGGPSLLQRWRDSLEAIQEECSDLQVHALFVQMPPPLRRIGETGLKIQATLVEQTMKTCASMDDNEGSFVSVADMLEGQGIQSFIYKDNMHPNARGHELIFRHLLPLVYDRLGITPHEPLPDPAEVLQSSYTT